MEMFLIKFVCAISFLTIISCSLTIRPRNARKLVQQSVEFRCGSNSVDVLTGKPQPVEWIFNEQCVYCAGVINVTFERRFVVDDTSVPGMYPLQIPNITVDDRGMYKCVDNPISGAAEIASALLVVIVPLETNITVLTPIADKGQSVFTQFHYKKIHPITMFFYCSTSYGNLRPKVVGDYNT